MKSSSTRALIYFYEGKEQPGRFPASNVRDKCVFSVKANEGIPHHVWPGRACARLPPGSARGLSRTRLARGLPLPRREGGVSLRIVPDRLLSRDRDRRSDVETVPGAAGVHPGRNDFGF